MDSALAVALIAGVVALASATYTALNARAIEQLKIDNERRKTEEQRRKEISGFSEPLARAAYDLQSRIWNIHQNFLVMYLVNGDERQRSYAIDNTVYLIAQYLCWTELVRREIQFIDLESNNETRKLLRLQDSISSQWGTGRGRTGLISPLFCIFAGEQRAIGEALIQTGRRGPECMGYGEFLKSFGEGVNPLIDSLRADVVSSSSNLAAVTERLLNLQHAMIDLLALLDPDYLRFPEDRRLKL